MRVGVLIVGHGSRNPQANTEFERLVQAYSSTRPDLDLVYGYVELADPTLSIALQEISRRCSRVVLLPLFLFAAGHVKNDMSIALERARRENPNIHFSVAHALGVHSDLVSLLRTRARSGFGGTAEKPGTAVIVIGRGSSDPDANGDFYKVVRLLAEGTAFSWVVPAFMGIARPLVSDVLELVARTRPDRVLVVPYLLFSGRLVERLVQQTAEFGELYRWIPTEVVGHLGIDPRLFSAIDKRLADALEGTHTLPCDTCQYRAPISGLKKVDGMRALLWSLRHSFTHTQAMPHEHAHPPLKKHVLVCGNIDCANRGSIPLISSLRRLVKNSGKQDEIRITRTSCQGRCGEGPTISVYPDGVWYRGVQECDAHEIVHEHLLADRLVSRLVDNIMQ